VDPIAEKFPHLSSYNYASNRLVTSIDLEGLQAQDENDGNPPNGGTPAGGSSIINPNLKQHFDSFMSSRQSSSEGVKIQNASTATNISSAQADNTSVNTTGIEEIANSQAFEYQRDQAFKDYFGFEPLKLDNLKSATLAPKDLESQLSQFDRQMHGSMRAGAKAYLLVTSVSGLSGLAAGGTRAMLSGSLKGGLSRINSQVAMNSVGNAIMSGGAEFTGQYIMSGNELSRVDIPDVAISAAFKSTPLTDISKAAIDYRLSSQKVEHVFGDKPFNQFAIEVAVSLGFRMTPLSSTSISREFGISPVYSNSPIEKFGQYSFDSFQSILQQGVTKTIENDFSR